MALVTYAHCCVLTVLGALHTEDWSKGMQKMRCACLEPRGGGIYTVDPRWKGDSNKAIDKATIALIFEVPGEGLRAHPDGYNGEDAWKITLVRRQ